MPGVRTIRGRIKQVAVTIIGGLLLVAGGILSLPLVPGPGLIVMIAGLALLASEYDWAKNYLHRSKQMLKNARDKVRREKSD